MNFSFGAIAGRRPRLNSFDLSHERKMSFNMGQLIPSLIQEIVPGDKFRVNTEIMMRLAPMIAPIMHRVNVFTHFFFVPNRLTWEEWEDFITGGREGDLTPAFPTILIEEARKGNFYKGYLPDFMGLPIVDVADTIAVDNSYSALPFRAYQLIYDQYYRDQNVSASIEVLLTSGQQFPAEQTKLTTVRQRAWEKDYFTSCLPWAQRGGSVESPISPPTEFATAVDGNNDPITNETLETEAAGIIRGATGQANARIDTHQGIDINDLRLAVRLQEWLEKNARGGARYIEQIMSHFGVRSSDSRLQRAEYLGGGKTPIIVSEVLQTANTAGLPVGTMNGHGLAVGNSNSFTKRFEEHGYVIGIVSVLPRTAYQQGVDRTFSKFDKTDFFWPEFANLGEQEVLNQEIYYSGIAGTLPQDTFGYQSRYAEYKFKHSSVHGDFRDELDFWHMGRKFAAEPVLNESFIESDPTDRIFAIEIADEHRLWVQLYNNIRALRPMPKFGTPTL